MSKKKSPPSIQTPASGSLADLSASSGHRDAISLLHEDILALAGLLEVITGGELDATYLQEGIGAIGRVITEKTKALEQYVDALYDTLKSQTIIMLPRAGGA